MFDSIRGTETSILNHTIKACTRFAHPTLLLDGFLLEGTMATTLKQQAWQSGLFLPDETAQWNETDWPPLVGEWRYDHATVVLNHPDQDTDSNNKGQTVVVLGGVQQGQGIVNSVLVLNLAESNMHWRQGPAMKKRRREHAVVVCNDGVYVMGGYNGGSLDCIERIDSNDLLQAALTTSTTHEINWTTLNCRLSTQRRGCCAVAVHNRYIVLMGGKDRARDDLSSVEIIDTTNQTVIEGPSMNVPRELCASAVVGHRIFVVGGLSNNHILDSVEYLDFAAPSGNEETKVETAAATVTFSSSSYWTTHSDLVLSEPEMRRSVVAVGSCLVVAGNHRTMEILDTHHNHVWNLPPLENYHTGCSLVTVANQVAVIGGFDHPTCASFPLMDKNSWCFRQLCEKHIQTDALIREKKELVSPL